MKHGFFYYPKRSLQSLKTKGLLWTQVFGFNPNVRFMIANKANESFNESVLPDAEICFASLWTTAHYLLPYFRTSAEFYFIQDYEPLFYPAGTEHALDYMRRHFGRFLGHAHDKFDPLTNAREVEWLDGMCVMFRRDVLEQTGVFDKQYFFDYEIGDLLIRTCARGWRILYDPAIIVAHLGAYSRQKTPRVMIESYRGQLIYHAKHRPDYVTMLRRIHLVLFWMKITFMQAACPLSCRADKWRGQIEILKETRKAIAEFKPDSVREREHIPRLD